MGGEEGWHRELHRGWGELPRRHDADPSDNESCVLPGAVVRRSPTPKSECGPCARAPAAGTLETWGVLLNEAGVSQSAPLRRANAGVAALMSLL
jgi:hypothetical protein